MSSQLNVSSLKGSHEAHDSFVRTYLKTETAEAEDCVEIALLDKLLETLFRDDKPELVTFVNGKIDNSPSASVPEEQRIRHLALYILLTQYPEQWNDMFEAAYTLLVGLLGIICNMKVTKAAPFPIIYPPMWTQKIFRLENYLAPGDLKGIIFGIDPLSDGSNPSKAATGYAFTFDRESRMNYFEPSSTKGLQQAYCLTNAENYAIHSRHLEEDLLQTYGTGMVNFIRTIRQGSYAGSKNDFKEPWISYNKAWLKYMQTLWILGEDDDNGSCIGRDRVLIFQNEHFLFNTYSTTGDFKAIKDLLENAPRCSHPSYIRAEYNHCLLKPQTWYFVKPKPGKPPPPPVDNARCNDSVHNFIEFLKLRGARNAFKCRCKTKTHAEHQHFYASVPRSPPFNTQSRSRPSSPSASLETISTTPPSAKTVSNTTNFGKKTKAKAATSAASPAATSDNDASKRSGKTTASSNATTPISTQKASAPSGASKNASTPTASASAR